MDSTLMQFLIDSAVIALSIAGTLLAVNEEKGWANAAFGVAIYLQFLHVGG